jgi:hypothetical protein
MVLRFGAAKGRPDLHLKEPMALGFGAAERHFEKRGTRAVMD